MPNPVYETVDIARLRPNPWNSNNVSSDNEQRIRESIRRNGLFKPIIVRELDDGTLQIIGGQHRWEQARELGHLNVPIVNLGGIDDAQAKEIGVIDNARYGADDSIMLADILKSIGTISDLRDFLPYGETDLNAIFSASVIDIDELVLTPETAEPENNTDGPEEKAPRATRTHAQVRFKLSIFDNERLTALIGKTQREQGFTQEDELTNAGDALVWLLRDMMPKASVDVAIENELSRLED